MTSRAFQLRTAAHVLLVTSLWATLPAGLLLTVQRGTQVPDHTTPRSAIPCEPSPLQFWTGSAERLVTPEEQVNTLTLASSSTLFQQVCQPGTLRLLLRGTPAEGVDAQLVVNLGHRNLLTTTATTERMVEVTVSQPGLLTISFVNDRYLPNLTPTRRPERVHPGTEVHTRSAVAIGGEHRIHPAPRPHCIRAKSAASVPHCPFAQEPVVGLLDAAAQIRVG